MPCLSFILVFLRCWLSGILGTMLICANFKFILAPRSPPKSFKYAPIKSTKQKYPPPCLWHMWSAHRAPLLCPGQLAWVSLDCCFADQFCSSLPVLTLLAVPVQPACPFFIHLFTVFLYSSLVVPEPQFLQIFQH